MFFKLKWTANHLPNLHTRFYKIVNMTHYNSFKCGFCKNIGHDMSSCCDPTAVFIQNEFHAILSQSNGDPFDLLDWLNMVLLNAVKFIAHKNNTTRTGTKHDLIVAIMDKLFPNYSNPLWKYPLKQRLRLLSIMRIRTNQILSFQRQLIETGIISVSIHSTTSLHSLDAESLDNIYRQFHREYREPFNAYYENTRSKKYRIKTLIVKKEEEDNDNDCSICYEKIVDCNEIHLQCGHRFCNTCIVTTLEKKIPQCALCRKKYEEFTICNQVVYESIKPYIIMHS
jgi:hypothetical protein